MRVARRWGVEKTDGRATAIQRGTGFMISPNQFLGLRVDLADADPRGANSLGPHHRQNRIGHLLQRNALVVRVAYLLACKDAKFSRTDNHCERIVPALTMILDNVG